MIFLEVDVGALHIHIQLLYYAPSDSDRYNRETLSRILDWSR
jgi:hypothetical protein